MKEKISLVKNLLQKRNARRREGKFVVEGPHLVEEAAKINGLIDFVLYSEKLPLVGNLLRKGIECLEIGRRQFAELSEVETPQGILAVVHRQDGELKQVLESARPLVLFCHEIQDPANLGTMIRTADAVNATGVILSRGGVDLYNQKVIRGTMGSLFHLPVAQIDNFEEALNYLKGRKIKLIATDLDAKKTCFEVNYRDPTAIVMGNEAAGLPAEVVKLCDEAVKIPVPGKAESLNVSVAAGIILYEALRQRTMQGNLRLNAAVP